MHLIFDVIILIHLYHFFYVLYKCLILYNIFLFYSINFMYIYLYYCLIK